MAFYSESEAQDILEELVKRAVDGEEIILTRDGVPVVQLVAVRDASEAHSRPPDMKQDENG
jgi:prevent-host-death family protein